MKKLAFVFLSTLCFSANAQKLPNVQQVSLRAPANIKIDGNIDEWRELKAYNKACDIYYTIANDEENIYLTVQAKESGIIEKIFNSGLQFTVNTTGNKKTDGSPAIIFPAYSDPKNKAYIDLDAQPFDSVKKASSERLAAVKFLRIANIKGIADCLLSVYNTEGIKVGVSLGDNMYLIYELAIPLKLLQITGGAVLNKITYNVKLNGSAESGYDLRIEGGRMLVFTGRDGKDYLIGRNTPKNWMKATSTDFWGEYTLAK